MSCVSYIAPNPSDDSTVVLEDLFVHHYVGLVRLASGLLDRDEACEEVVQDVFAEMLAGDRRPAPGHELAYLRSAVLNRARSRLRRRWVRRRPLAPVPEAPSQVDSLMDRLEHERILDVVRGLPRRQSEVLVLRYQADLSEAEIAATLGISAGSVKTHASRGLAAVRQRLEAQ